MEYYTKHASDLIENRNTLEQLYGQNIILFFVFLYLETNSMLTAKILEGLLYFEFNSPSDLPYLIYDDTFNYIVAVPTMIILQIYLLGNNLTIFMPLSFLGCWT